MKVDISLSIDYYVSVFHVCKAYRYTAFQFRAQVHRDRDTRKRAVFAFIILQKHNALFLLWVHTNRRSLYRF